MELSADEWIRLGRECLDAGTLFLLVTGGEPFLREDFRKIYEALSEMGFIITLYTNGTLITDETINWLSKRPPAKLTITLYGASCETYKQLCGDGKAFDRVYGNFKKLIDAGINLNIRSTITKRNLHDLDAMRQIAFLHDIPFDYSCMIYKPVRGAVSDAESERLSPEEIIKLRSKDILPDFIKPGDYTYLKKEIKSKLPPLSCTAASCSWWITWDGRLTPCSLMDTPYVKIKDKTFDQLWREIQEMVKDIPGATKCKSCPDKEYCSVCPGILQAETGTFDQTSDYICDFAHRLKSGFQMCKEI
ncbi:Coenzyme PQQ synthesis protein E [bioreactor metagenome]|uniref:Coenzyme PQQ synthesis protein E n=1 Tax=bioreactor metagenome TaxID=1076179 RepID=A0A645BF03_9ZZZZ